MFYLKALLTGLLFVFSINANAIDVSSNSGSADCENSHAFENIMDNICWSCVLPMRMMGFGDSPKGAAEAKVFCSCGGDSTGGATVGWQLGYWQPARVEEVVKTPYCSPFLGGVKLQDTTFNIGKGLGNTTEKGTGKAYYDYHYFAYPIFAMMQLLLIPECAGDGYVDLDLLNISEIDPTWNNDLLAFVLNPEAVVFANPLSYAWCAVDCVSTTAVGANEVNYFCAGCDGTLYPLTGNVGNGDDQTRLGSLVIQRTLGALHRRGVALKTMGDEQMCGATYSFFIPKSQYKVSMLHPVPEAQEYTKTVTSGIDGTKTTAYEPSGSCCHDLGQSVHRWSTMKGGRARPGKDNMVFLIWRWVDCCVPLF